jgi:hypothetical protein
MSAIEVAIYLSSAYPVARAWLSNRSTTMVHALSWTVAAWLAWFGALLLAGTDGAATARYLALCLTGCAGIAVLGARRPIVGAWNFVLLALLGVLLLPLLENALLSTPLLDPLRLIFAMATVLVGVLNYLPTRFGLATMLVGTACFAVLLALAGWPEKEEHRSFFTHVSYWLLAAACWSALLARQPRWAEVAVFDREWLTFRDRFGLMWGQRVREQFNRAAANAGWPVYLRWRGLRKTARDVVLPGADQIAIVETLREILKRFHSAVHH